MPVLPRMTAPPIQPPLGVLSNTLPALSIIAMCVVSLIVPRIGSAFGAGWPGFAASVMFATQYFHSFTFESKGRGFPAMKDFDARFGLIIAARCFAYSFDNRPSAGVC